ncbi:MAG: cyclase family protein [Candidatus Omnitrophota bacterium]|nr:cyclase family protein [Candidatus Omnitrophota bacterium]
MRYKYLSYEIKESIPVYGKRAMVNMNPVRSIKDGDTANVYEFTMQNHWGTHVDAPRHFFDKGKGICDFPPDHWIFDNPQIVEVRLSPGEILTNNGWKDDIDPGTDILLFRSGWNNFRNEEKYFNNNPGIDPSVGTFIREKFTNIKAVGIDWISVSAYRKRDLGREAHRKFLNPEGINDPVLLVEDMDLSAPGILNGLIVVPMRMDVFDSAPCTVIGRFDDQDNNFRF